MDHRHDHAPAGHRDTRHRNIRKHIDHLSRHTHWYDARVRRIVWIIILLGLLPVLGMAGLVLLEDWPAFDAFYMAVITLTTVGYGEIHPLHMHGRIFIVIYIILGLGLFLYVLTQMGEILLSLTLEDHFGRRRMHAKIKELNNHVIVCGFGRMGQRICERLASEGTEFCVVERNEEAIHEARRAGYNYLIGDASHDEILDQAGVHRARGVVAALTSDADNLLLVLTARILNSHVRIVARALEENNIRKLERAGAQDVICMYRAGAERLVERVLR